MTIFQWGAAAVAFSALAGCATMGNQTPEQQVEARAATYWKARASADAKTAYSLLAPAYRNLNSEQAFIRQHGAGANVKEAGVAKVSCESQERCTASISLTAKPLVPGLNLPLVTAYLDDTWVLEEGQWWRFQAP
ncbi:MAG: hypothetical protein KKB95_20885 [Gammaproteobacteria bacterium]|nr:hypothetical protein [Gammaproteobacteria bacterium]MBU1507005.1 hypothetical protein [Gammaproteobacteria bacterium]MBU1818660.1 hypothetical protein [Gammaproteobacteria bacterium]MBU2121793.1 hypothetical protein [Gammaproteobacteria bacterium]MBU2172812.1 hypothetical protein [Gammaproteobacteria bacterium]